MYHEAKDRHAEAKALVASVLDAITGEGNTGATRSAETARDVLAEPSEKGVEASESPRQAENGRDPPA
jgi:hypothetical protein